MNYRHSFHAGNFADVVKHAVLSLIIESLKRKDSAFAAIDTHAGIGQYDFWKQEPNKTDEYKDGIGRLWNCADAPAELEAYLTVVKAMNGQLLRHYPGSPELVRRLMRPQDRLILAEKHPEDARTLKDAFHSDKRTSVHETDGWQALKAFLPPKEKRGVALIDPAFEEDGEYERLAKALIQACERWPQGIILGWHPIKETAKVENLHRALKASGLPGIMAIRHHVRRPDEISLAGSGLILVNPPYKLDEGLARLMPFLAERLSQGEGATACLDWLSKDV